MNFIDTFFLWLFLLPSKLYVKGGVDTIQLKSILKAKLTMDNRRPTTFGGNRRRKSEKKEINKATLGTMLGSLIMGLVMLYTFAVGVDMVTKLTMYMTMFIFMLCITLITDFTSVLIDVRDNLIILPKPVSDRTFVAARLLHITIRTSLVVLPLSLPGCIMAAFSEGPLIILPFLFMVLLMTLLSIFFINAVYILILKITTPAKFQSIIGSIQIGFVILLMMGYQLMPRMVQSSAFQNLSIADFPFIGFYPPFWFADACVLMTGKGFSPESMMNLVLSIVVPLLSVWLVVRVFAPSFNRKLGMISAGTAEKSVPSIPKTGTKSVSFLERLAGWLTKSGAEYAGFLFAARMIGRSRDYKMKVFPSIGYMVVFGAIILFKEGPLKEMSSGGSKMVPELLMVMYFGSMLLSTALLQLPYSDKFKASWLFHIAPIENPGIMISGAVKCVIVFFFIPLALLLMVGGFILQGPAVLPNMLLGCMNVMVIGLLMAYLMIRNLPFSKAQEAAAGGSTFIRSMLLLMIPGAFGLAHWFLSGFQWVILLLLLITTVVPWLVLDEIKKMSWGKMKD